MKETVAKVCCVRQSNKTHNWKHAKLILFTADEHVIGDLRLKINKEVQCVYKQMTNSLVPLRLLTKDEI